MRFPRITSGVTTSYVLMAGWKACPTCLDFIVGGAAIPSWHRTKTAGKAFNSLRPRVRFEAFGSEIVEIQSQVILTKIIVHIEGG